MRYDKNFIAGFLLSERIYQKFYIRLRLLLANMWEALTLSALIRLLLFGGTWVPFVQSPASCWSKKVERHLAFASHLKIEKLRIPGNQIKPSGCWAQSCCTISCIPILKYAHAPVKFSGLSRNALFYYILMYGYQCDKAVQKMIPVKWCDIISLQWNDIISHIVLPKVLHELTISKASYFLLNSLTG